MNKMIWRVTVAYKVVQVVVIYPIYINRKICIWEGDFDR